MTTVLILRGMARRYRRQEGAGEVDDDVPYGPSAPPPESSEPEPVAT